MAKKSKKRLYGIKDLSYYLDVVLTLVIGSKVLQIARKQIKLDCSKVLIREDFKRGKIKEAFGECLRYIFVWLFE
jgi:hypothetical protein